MLGKILSKTEFTTLLCALCILLPSKLLGLSFYDGGYDDKGFLSNTVYLNYSPHEFVNAYSGNLILSHSDITLPGNGSLDLAINRIYNSKIIYLPPPFNVWVPDEGSMGIGWDLHFGRIIPYAEPFLPVAALTMSDGSVYNVYNNNHQNVNSRMNSPYLADNFAALNFDQQNEVWTMTLTDGTIYKFDRRIRNSTGYVEQYFVSSIKDTNGNEIKIDYFDCCNFQVDVSGFGGTLGTCPGDGSFASEAPHIRQITDSVGRVIKFNWLNNSCRSNTQSNVISSIDVNGKVYEYTYIPVVRSSSDGQGEDTVYALVEAKPPDGPSWIYNYESDDVQPNGEIKSVRYPSGGVVDYGFDTLTPNPQNHADRFENTIPLKTRALTTRRVSGPNITPGAWTYSYGVTENKNSTTVNDPCGDKVVYKFHGALESSYIGDWAVGLLDEEKVFDDADNQIESEKNSWNPYQITTNANVPEGGFFFPLLSSRAMTREGNNYITNYSYNTFYAAPTRIEEQGELTRTTDILYFENISGGKYIVGKPAVRTISNGIESKSIASSYDENGNIDSEDKYGVVTDFFYHPNGNLAWEKNARGFYTHYDQYNFGVAGRIKYGSSNDSGSDPIYSETRTINWEGTIASLANGRGHQSSFNYDKINRLIEVNPPLSGEASTVITYDNTGGRGYTVKKGISELRYNLDGFGRPIGTQSNVGVFTEKRYDQCGRQVYESLPFSFDGSTPNTGNGYTYDSLGRITQITRPDSSLINYLHSANNVTITDERRNNSTFNFKSFGEPDDKRLISIADSQNSVTLYEHDLLGNIIRVKSPSGRDRVFNYNSKNFLVSETNPENGTTTFSRDELGNLISQTDSQGQVTQYQYDGLNRLILVDHPSGEDDVSYTYDGANNRTSMQSSSGSYSYSYQYDESNRLTRQNVISGNGSYIVDFVYDERNNLIRTIYPSGEVANQFYDAGNRLFDVFDASNNLFVGNITYHPSGAPTHYINANSVSSDFTFDNRHRLKTAKISRPFPELKIIKEGLGKGTVNSNPLGIDCGSDCSQIYPADGITVTLTAAADQDSNFVEWGGNADCSDGQVFMNANKTCIATFALKAQQFTLTVSKSGGGTGTVTSSPPGIDCGTDCSENYDANTVVTLTPSPEAGSIFTGWSGDEDCGDASVTLDSNKSCTATFEPNTQQFTLTVNKIGSGSGTVSSSPPGINCGSDCTENYDANTSVSLTATPFGGYTFVVWGGDADCSDGMVTMDANKTCNAVFEIAFTLTIQKNGTGGGRIRSTLETGPPTIDCGDDCTEVYPRDTLVFFQIIPDPGSRFTSWSGTPGCPASVNGGVKMEGHLNCRAQFDLLPGKTLVVNKEGNGSGRVVSDPAGINCGTDCSQNYDDNTQVRLNAIPDGGSVFSGWSGDADCSDGVVTLDVSKTCTASFTQSTGQFHLSIDISGFGKVLGLSGNPSVPDVRIDCKDVGDLGPFRFNDCEEDYVINTAVRLKTLTLSECPPGPGEFCTDPEVDYNSTFIGWDGDPDCLDGEVTMDADKSCTAVFTPFKLDVFITGKGTVTRSPQGNTCTTLSNCSKYYEPNTQVTLTPMPNSGSSFTGWSEDPDCSDGVVTMDGDKKCRATFTTSSQQFTLNVNKTGTGAGTVTSSPAGINCGTDCTRN